MFFDYLLCVNTLATIKLRVFTHRYLKLQSFTIVWNVILLTYRESDITKERIQKIMAVGTNVVLTTGGIDDLCLKYFVEAGAMAVRRCKKVDLKRIAKATGGKDQSNARRSRI